MPKLGELTRCVMPDLPLRAHTTPMNGAILTAAREPSGSWVIDADFDVFPFDGDCARAFGAVAAALRASGRKPAARAYDARSDENIHLLQTALAYLT